MKHHQHQRPVRRLAWALSGALLVGAALCTQAAELGVTTGTEGRAPHGLSTAQRAEVRVVSRNVLNAKRGGSDQGTDADAQRLQRLRSAIDAALAAELDPAARTEIRLQGEEGAELRQRRERKAARVEQAHAELRSQALEMRQPGNRRDARPSSDHDEQIKSGGLPVGAQRAELFQKLGARVEAAVADQDEGGGHRIAKLQAIRESLQAKNRSVVDEPPPRGTPTLQAMPAGYAPPKQDQSPKK